MSRIRLLIADDHTIVRTGIRLLLSSQEDIEVVGEASDGWEAVEKTRELAPDIILMDLTMPDLNGFEATRRIREQSPETKVLALTMHENERYIFQVIHAGASGYVVKGASPEELLEAIRTVHRGQNYLSAAVTRAILDDYVKRAREGKEPEAYDGLTSREREVLRLVGKGLTSKEIAEALYLSPHTVERHKANIMEKLNLHSRRELIRYALRKGLIREGSESP
jgi:two-component system response regulator NreC